MTAVFNVTISCGGIYPGIRPCLDAPAGATMDWGVLAWGAGISLAAVLLTWIVLALVFDLDSDKPTRQRRAEHRERGLFDDRKWWE